MNRGEARAVNGGAPVQARPFSALSLRCTVVLPGAFAEGALAVLLPWLVVQAALGTPWLGAASALVVLAAMAGTLAAPILSRQLGTRGMTVWTGVATVAGLVAASALWMMDAPGPAYGFALVAIAADSACDVGFSSRMPLIARLSRQSLVQFSGANWLWGVPGAAAGSVFAGWAMSTQSFGALLLALILASLLVAITLAVLLPRDARHRGRILPGLCSAFSASLWKPQAVAIAIIIMATGFFFGPLDNLLIPAHLLAHQLHADTFGNLMAAAGVGLAIGLAATQWVSPSAYRRPAIAIGLAGGAAQIGLVLWLPPGWILIAGMLVTSALVAPLLPMLEAAFLRAASAVQRTLFIALVATLTHGADISGSLSFAWVVNRSGSDAALAICLAAAGLAATLYAIGLAGRQITKR